MTLRDRLQTALKDAMRARAADRLSTLRLINAAIKDREIANRGDGTDAEIGDSDILAILGRLVKQRQESARAYEVGGRMDLAQKELAEVQVIEEFLPRQLDPAEVDAAITAAMAEAGAASIRDMGRVIAALKGKYTGQMDFGAVGPMVKARVSLGRVKLGGPRFLRAYLCAVPGLQPCMFTLCSCHVRCQCPAKTHAVPRSRSGRGGGACVCDGTGGRASGGGICVWHRGVHPRCP